MKAGKGSFAYGQTQRREQAKRFMQEAIVSKQLLFECLWKDFAHTGNVSFQGVLLDLAMHFELLVRVPRTAEGSENGSSSGSGGGSGGMCSKSGNEPPAKRAKTVHAAAVALPSGGETLGPSPSKKARTAQMHPAVATST